MTPEELKALQDSIAEKMKAAVSKEDLEAVKTEVLKMNASIEKMGTFATDEAVKAAVKDIEEKLKAQWEEVVKMNQKPVDVQPANFREAIKAAIISSGAVESYNDEFGQTRYKFKDSGNQKFEFAVKAAVDMNTVNAVRPGGSPGVSIGALTDYGMQAQKLPNTLDQHFIGAGFATQNTTEKYFGVLIESTETDGSGVKAETAVAGDSSYLWETKEFKVFDFAVKFRVHQNTLDDMENVLSRIEELGYDRLMSKIDGFVLGASGDNSATPAGLLTSGYFTAYNTALRAGEVQAANIVNVIKNAALQATLSDEYVDTVVLNPEEAAEIEDLKDGENNTINLAGVRLDATGRLAYIYGLRVHITKKMTANTAVLLNSSESLQFGIRKGMGVRMGYDKTEDFSKGIVTTQLETRLAIGLGKPKSIIYISSISAAATALAPVVTP